MLSTLRTFLNRPLYEDFSVRAQLRLSLLAGFYVFVFLIVFTGTNTNPYNPYLLYGSFGLGVVVASLLANTLPPLLLPILYDDDRWTVGRHALHILWVLLCITTANQLISWLFGLKGPSFGAMYAIVTAVGFFPISVGVMVAEQRRLNRNLAQAQQLNSQLDRLHESVKTTPPATPELPKGILLTGEGGKDRLSLLPNQLIYIESVGNYVEVHWLNFMFPQKTILRSTLKDVEAALADQPQFFRCHRAFLVNLRAVSHTTGNSRGYQLTMSGSQQDIPVSRTYVPAFDDRMSKLAALPRYP
ncbi:LytR/AlgR family response regulator transcription factor [Fibrella aquatilis]|uniref:LytTR family transcriptional regulator n=1 Tax=Fibrella aquatilis TaxID=2817059 RepID=A0A939G4Y8_9BACT|nr:LytTR family DNA-binding domain-containing protein [Fibrella aquatilis]MBO0930317.1 LytTR family transcriptional regulator [Fibrella aquatilis]